MRRLRLIPSSLFARPHSTLLTPSRSLSTLLSTLARSFSSNPKLQVQQLQEKLQESKSAVDDDYVLDIEDEQEQTLLSLDPMEDKTDYFEYPPESVRFRMQQQIEPLKGVQIPELYENLNFEEEIEPAIVKVRELFKYNNEELKYLLKRNKKAFTPFCFPEVVKSFYLDELNYPLEKVRSLVLRGPGVLLKNESFLKDQYRVMQEKLKLSDEEILTYLIQVPELLHWSGTYHMCEIFDRFELYMGWDQEQVAALFKKSPWLMAQTIVKIETLLKLFKGYKFDSQRLYEVLLKDGSIFGTPPSVLRQSIRVLRKNFKISSRQILNTVLVKHPEYLIQSKFQALETKLKLLRENGCSDLMLRRVFQHYPEFYLKSISSFKAKIKYLKQTQGIDLSTNPYFPLCLMFNFRHVIYPRMECLGKERVQSTDLAEILSPTDEQFCEKFSVRMERLVSRTLEKKKEERDVLWRYVANI